MKTAIWVGEPDFEEWHGNDNDVPVSLFNGAPTEISDQLAQRLARDFAGLVSIDGQIDAKPLPTVTPETPAPAAEPPAIDDSPAFFAWWNDQHARPLVALIESWDESDPDAPSRETIHAIASHEEHHHNRVDVLDALEDAYLATPEAPAAQTNPPTVEELLEAHNRKQLDELAATHGVQEPEKLKDKTAVAEAIVAALEPSA